jgi:hypothetical protein
MDEGRIPTDGGRAVGGITSGDVGGAAELAARVAAQAAFLGLSPNLDRLYDDVDPCYRVLLRASIHFLGEMNREEAERAKSGG